MRSGIGYDIHRLISSEKETSVFLGGITIPSFSRIEAHSDGDVLLHALTDALLGALALGDIGRWFPDNDPQNKNRKSSEFVTQAMAEVNRMGWRVRQMDATVILERPKLRPHIDDIRKNIATLLSTELSSISVKAKTAEGLGPIGEGRAIEAHVIVTLEEKT